MHNEEYIASGILELYAAGGLTPAEREEVELRAAASPEIKAALDEACAAMEAYAATYSKAPRPQLKASIMAQLQQPEKGLTNIDQRAQEKPVVPLYTQERNDPTPYKWLMAASIALFLISGALSIIFYNKWQQAEGRLQLALATEQQLAQNTQTVNLKLQQQEQALAILQNPDVQYVQLQAVEGQPEASMQVYWNQEQQQVYIGALRLPAPPAGKQYQLWALNNGQPIDAGMIALQHDYLSLQQMKGIESAQAFAVTLEPEGGSVNPTLEQLVVMGEVQS